MPLIVVWVHLNIQHFSPQIIIKYISYLTNPKLHLERLDKHFGNILHHQPTHSHTHTHSQTHTHSHTLTHTPCLHLASITRLCKKATSSILCHRRLFHSNVFFHSHFLSLFLSTLPLPTRSNSRPDLYVA